MPSPAAAALAAEIYEIAYRDADSFESNNIGADLAYLLGAILTQDKVDWSEQWPPLLEVLTAACTSSHPVWAYIITEPAGKSLTDYYDEEIGSVAIELANGRKIYSGWCDKDDPDTQLVGDWVRVEDALGNEAFYVEAVDFTTGGTLEVQQKLQDFICACLGVPVP